MKKHILFIVCSFVFFYNAEAQTSVEFANPVYKFKSQKDVDQVGYISLNITGQVATVSQNIQLNTSRNDNAQLYGFVENTFKVHPNNTQLEIPYSIKKSVLKKADTVSISFTDPLSGKIRSAQIYIAPEEEGAKPSTEGRLMFLNAFNFDFAGNLNGSNYVGHLNIFSPAMGSTKKWGFNTGILRINYAQKDTALESNPVLNENFYINHFDTVGAGLKYLRRKSRYSTIKKNQVWSFYFQPFFQINDKESASRILLHAHLELLASKWSAATTSTLVAQDTAVLAAGSANGYLIRHNYNSKSVLTINSLSAYFGGGLTYDMKLWNKGEFFFSGTLGLTSNQPSPGSTDIDSFIFTGSKKNTDTREWSGFYLVRANYIQKLNESAQVVVGTDIRGFLKDYAPQYAAYVGLNVGLESILKIISGDKKE